MNLDEILVLRPVPAAGLFLSLTRRCPLACAHCSTQSLMTSEEHPSDLFLRFVDTFTTTDHPELVLMTGGEALLRPALVQDITERCHAVGARAGVISGMFWARQASIPPEIQRTIDGLDHFTASLDIYHEEQVARALVLAALRRLLDQGKDLSLQITALSTDEPYVEEVLEDVDRVLGDSVPVLLTQVHPVGRAREWLHEEPEHEARYGEPQPCAEAAWPVVTYDGTVTACSNQVVVDGPVPPHLRLGHTSTDDWVTVRDRMLRRSLPRAIRLWGPEYVAERFGSPAARCDGYCETCYTLSDHPEIIPGLEEAMARPTMDFVEEQVVDIQRRGLLDIYGSEGLAHRLRSKVTVG